MNEEKELILKSFSGLQNLGADFFLLCRVSVAAYEARLTGVGGLSTVMT